MEIKKSAIVNFYPKGANLDDITEKIIKHAEQARDRAYAPYSRFKVGAALLLDDGSVVEGNNQENAAYPSGLCAERVALFNWGANYPATSVLSMAISVVAEGELQPDKDMVPPCGACLQVMSEVEKRQKKQINIFISTGQGVYQAQGVSQFLPFQFSTRI